MFFRAILLASLIIAPVAFAPVTAAKRMNPAASAGEPSLVGTWRLVRYENRTKDGKIDKLYGEKPLSYFVYVQTGHLSAHILRNLPSPALASGSKTTATEAEKMKAYDAYEGYFGTYRVGKVKHVLHHSVEGALDTTCTDTEQLRPYLLSGYALIIEGDSADGSSYYREPRRVR